MNQEAALQERIDKAAADMEQARQLREAISLQQPEPSAAQTPKLAKEDSTYVSRAPTMNEV